MPRRVILTENNREALIIRFRRILILGLIDFFNTTNEFNKLIIKELIDIREGLIKAFAEAFNIPLFHQNGKWIKLEKIFRDILNQNLSQHFKRKITELNSQFISREFNSLKKIRNDETHYLNLPQIPKETVLRVWRLIYDLINLIDWRLPTYAKKRPETEDFFFLQEFFKKAVLLGNIEKIDDKSLEIFNLDDIKKIKESYPYIKEDGIIETIEIERERDIWEIIELIRSGEYLEN